MQLKVGSLITLHIENFVDPASAAAKLQQKTPKVLRRSPRLSSLTCSMFTASLSVLCVDCECGAFFFCFLGTLDSRVEVGWFVSFVSISEVQW